MIYCGMLLKVSNLNKHSLTLGFEIFLLSDKTQTQASFMTNKHLKPYRGLG